MASEELKRIIKEGAAKEQGSGSELSRLRPFELLDADCLAGLELAEEKVSYEAGDTVVVTGQFDGTLLYGLISGTARIVRPADTEAHRDLRIYRHLISLAERDGEKSVIREMPRHSQLAEQCGVTDRDAAAAVALLIEKGIVRRDYPSLVIEDMAALRASAY